MANSQDMSKPKITLTLAFGVAMALLGTSFQLGFNIGVMNSPANEIKDFFFGKVEKCVESLDNGSNLNCTKMTNGTNFRDTMYALAVSAYALGALFGSLFVIPINHKFGSRAGLFFTDMASLVAALYFGIAKPAQFFGLLILARIFIGFYSGLGSGIVAIYINDILPKEWKASTGWLSQLSLAAGILFAQILGLEALLGNEFCWPYLLAFTCVPSFIQLVGMPFMPSSPRFFFNDGLVDKAQNELTKLRGTDDVENEMAEMESEMESYNEQLTVKQLFYLKEFHWQLITILVMMVSRQLSGIGMVFFYSNIIFKSAGILDENSQDLASLAVGVVNVIMTGFAAYKCKSGARKFFLVTGFVVMIFWLLMMTVVLNLLEKDLVFLENILLVNDGTNWLSLLILPCVIGYLAGYGMGPGPLPWIVISELFHLKARLAVYTLASIVNWTCLFAVGISFPALAKITGPYVFVLFMCFCIAISVFLYYIMPETKGRSIEEIRNLYASRNNVQPTSVEGNNNEESIPLKVINSCSV